MPEVPFVLRPPSGGVRPYLSNGLFAESEARFFVVRDHVSYPISFFARGALCGKSTRLDGMGGDLVLR